MPEFDREKFYDVSRTMAAADKLLPADEQPERCQGLPLRDELANVAANEMAEWYGERPPADYGLPGAFADAVLAVIRTRIEALIEANQGMDPRTRVGMWEVLALLEGQEHATQLGKPTEEGSR